MTVQAGMSDELWAWLLEHGWREMTYRPDRRRYREIPGSWVTRLTDCDPEMRARLLAAAIGKASLKPLIGNPDSLPVYVERQ